MATKPTTLREAEMDAYTAAEAASDAILAKAEIDAAAIYAKVYDAAMAKARMELCHG